MITTIPIGVGWFIGIVAVVAIGSCIFATHASLHLERKEIAAEKLETIVGKGILHHRQEIHDEKHRVLCKREDAVSEQEKQLGSIAAREAELHRLEHDLGRAAHDMAVQTNMAMHQTMDDTVITIPELET